MLFNSLNSSGMALRQPVPEPFWLLNSQQRLCEFSEVKAIISVVTCAYLVVTQGITFGGGSGIRNHESYLQNM